jgi:hypothetical protein
MKTTVDTYQFINVMTGHGFTRAGAVALFDYLEQYEEETGQELDFDPIALCCDFTEYKDLQEIAREYGEEYSDLDYLEQSTTVIEFEGGIIIFNF